jgi:UDP-3-O-[3-hydroxymyristoyl] glucosamine N-acyltransferase
MGQRLSGKEGKRVSTTVQQLAALVQGEVHGDPALVIRAACAVHEAGPDDITFIDHERNARHLKGSPAGAAVVPTTLVPEAAEARPYGMPPRTVIRVTDPLLAFVTIVQHLKPPAERPAAGIDPRAAVHPSAQLGPGTAIHPFAAIGEGAVLGARCQVHAGAIVGRRCRLGDDVVLHPHAVLYDGVTLGDRVIVHAHAVLGADGFGYRFQQGQHVKVPQLGSVEVGEDVEIGAGTTVDRGTFQATRVGEGTKIDNLVMIGHNCRIGRHNLLVSQVGIAGSCTTGDYVVMAGQVGVADHLDIGAGAVIGARAGLHQDVPAGERILGTPGRPEREAKRILLSLDHLPGLVRKVRRLEQHLGLGDPGTDGGKDEAA